MTVERWIRLLAGSFVLISLSSGPLGQRQLVVVHRICGRQPVSIGNYPLVPDGGSGQVGRSEKALTSVPGCRAQPSTCNLESGIWNPYRIYAARFSSFAPAGSGSRSVSELIFFSLSIKKISMIVPSCNTVLTVIFFFVTSTTK